MHIYISYNIYMYIYIYIYSLYIHIYNIHFIYNIYFIPYIYMYGGARTTPRMYTHIHIYICIHVYNVVMAVREKQTEWRRRKRGTCRQCYAVAGVPCPARAHKHGAVTAKYSLEAFDNSSLCSGGRPSSRASIWLMAASINRGVERRFVRCVCLYSGAQTAPLGYKHIYTYTHIYNICTYMYVCVYIYTHM